MGTDDQSRARRRAVRRQAVRDLFGALAGREPQHTNPFVPVGYVRADAGWWQRRKAKSAAKRAASRPHATAYTGPYGSVAAGGYPNHYPGAAVVVVDHTASGTAAKAPPAKRGARRGEQVPAAHTIITPGVHGKTVEQLQAEQQDDDADTTWSRLWPHLAVWVAAIGAAGVVGLLWLAVGLGAPVGWTTATVAAVTAVAGGVWWSTRGTRMPAEWRSWLAAALVFAGGWLTVSTATGPSTYSPAVLGVATLGFGARWWRANRIGHGPYEPEPKDDEPEDPKGAEHDWDQYVGWKSGGPLPNSWLHTLNEIRDNSRDVDEWTLQLDRGKQTIKHVIKALPLISTGLEEPIDRLVVEEHPSRNPSQVLFKTIRRSPMDGPVRFEAPQLSPTGLAGLGPYVDGDGENLWRVYQPDGMYGGGIIGRSGIGKSRVIENLATNMRSRWLTLPTVVWWLDPQSGKSSNALKEHADVFGGLADAETILEAFEVFADVRNETTVESEGFQPVPCTCPGDDAARIAAMVSGEHDLDACRYMPGLCVMIDECHEPFALKYNGKMAANRWGDLGRKVRKNGGSIIGASQYPGQETYGGYEPLRQALFGSNAAVLSVASNIAGGLVPGLEVDPRDLPPIPGYAYSVRVGEFGRTAPWLNRLQAVDEVDEHGQTRVRLNAAEWLAAQPRLALEPAMTHELGDWYRRRHRDTEQIRRASRERIELARRGLIRLSSRPRPGEQGGDTGSSNAAGGAREAVLPVPRVPEFRLLPGGLTDQAEPADENETVQGDAQQPATAPVAAHPCTGLSPAACAVYDALSATDPRSPGELQQLLDRSESGVRGALRELVDAELAARERHGSYLRTEPSSAQGNVNGDTDS